MKNTETYINNLSFDYFNYGLDDKNPKNRWKMTELYFQFSPNNGGSAALLQAALYDGCFGNPIVRKKAILNFSKLTGKWRDMGINALQQSLVKDIYVKEVAELVLKEMTQPQTV